MIIKRTNFLNKLTFWNLKKMFTGLWYYSILLGSSVTCRNYSKKLFILSSRALKNAVCLSENYTVFRK